MSDGTEPTISFDSFNERFKVWEKYEDIAMHFNEMIIKLRTHALGGMTVVIALSGIAVNFAGGPTTEDQWDVIFGTVLVLICAWIAIAILDLCYYHKLLLGAVDALLELEKDSPIKLSTRVEERFGKRKKPSSDDEKVCCIWFQERLPQIGFYLMGLLPLVAGAIMTKLVAVSIATPSG